MIVPETADQDTLELKLPVPETAAEHWLVWPVCMLAGAQDVLTEVIVGDFIVDVKLPPLHPATIITKMEKGINAVLRSIVLMPFHKPERPRGSRQTRSCS